VEIGAHHELLKRDGLYSQLYRRQLDLSQMDELETAS
jgi:ABC-type multidrug transport system fused ATPase/permease subunit